MTTISKRHLKAWKVFNEELEAFRAEAGEEFATLYEDANTTREVKGFEMSESGILTWWECETFPNVKTRQEREQMINEEDAREWLNFWRAAFRRAKRYWAMDAEKLDKIQDGELEDMQED
jgi:hypothetical protein